MPTAVVPTSLIVRWSEASIPIPIIINPPADAIDRRFDRRLLKMLEAVAFDGVLLVLSAGHSVPADGVELTPGSVRCRKVKAEW